MAIRLGMLDQDVSQATLTAEERDFLIAEDSVLEELCQNGFFMESRPEDEVVKELSFGEFEDLSEDAREIYRTRVRPLLVAYYENPDTFPAVYAKARES